MKKNKISKNWINKQKRDIYVRQSKVDGYRSRAVYKLIEINQKFKILKNGISLIDLGSAPGSWSQYLSKNIKNGKILSIDIKKIDPIDNVFQIKGDFTQIRIQELIKNHFNSKIDVVLSDMAENTTGNKNVDDISAVELCKKAMFFDKEILNKNFIKELVCLNCYSDELSLHANDMDSEKINEGEIFCYNCHYIFKFYIYID